MSTSSGDDGGKSEIRSVSSKGPILAPSKFSLGGNRSGGGFSGLKASKLHFGSSFSSSKAKEEDPRESSKKEEASNTKEDPEESRNGSKSMSGEEKTVKKTDSSSSSSSNSSSSSSSGVSFLPLSKNSAVDSAEATVSRLTVGDEDSVGTSSSKIGGFTFGENVMSRVQTHKGGFTFGENLKERVTSQPESSSQQQKENEETKDVDKKEAPDKNAPESNYFKTTEAPPLKDVKNGGTPQKTLSEAAADYEESHAVKRKYEEVAVKTGEEDESNVIQLPAKLHTFDNTKRNWSEKGRGILRLNDMDDTSRLVMRSVGVLKVILNTKLFSGMSWERPSEKSIRFSGADDEGAVKIFLLTGSAKDMERLFQLGKTRIHSLQNKKTKVTSP